jgi:hypothetical protein
MQKCIDRANAEQQAALIDRIVQFTPQLIRDQYGNYVVQYVIELKMLPVNGRIVDTLRGSIIELSNEKFSSNVIEKVSTLQSKGSVSTSTSSPRSSSSSKNSSPPSPTSTCSSTPMATM